MGPFAKTIFESRYAYNIPISGPQGGGGRVGASPTRKETWPELSNRVSKNILASVGLDMRMTLPKETRSFIEGFKFIPAGRYLYSAGRPYHQCCNCYSGDTKAVTSKGAICLRDLVGIKPTLMTTGGEWKESEVHSFGVQKLYAVTLSFGKSKKVVYATANHSWRVASTCGKLRLHGKKKVDTVDLSAGDTLCQVFGYGISRTFVSPHGAAHGLVFGDGTDVKGSSSRVRLCGEKTELKKLFSLFPQSAIYSPDILVSNLPCHYKQRPSLDLDRSYLLGWLAGYFAADGCVSKDGNCTLACANKRTLEFVKDVAYIVGIGVNPIRETTNVSNLTGKECTLYSVSFRTSTLTRDFFLRDKHAKRFKESKRETYWKVVSVEKTDREEEVFCAIVPETHEFVLEDNILVGNCLLLRAHDSREGWSELVGKSCKGLMTGAGIGAVYSDIRHENAPIRKTGGIASGPLPLIQIINECGRGVMQGGTRRAAIWAGLRWNHPDIHKFIKAKNWPEEIIRLKEKDFSFPAPLDHTNISVGLDDDFFTAYHDPDDIEHPLANSVYWSVIEQMLRTGDPGFTVDVGKNSGENLRNACGEATSRETDDICNLGSLNMGRFNDIGDFEHAVECATAFLLAGSVYTDVPYTDVDKVLTKNRRLGLGLMGIHEWLLKRGYRYEPNDELWQWLKVYEKGSNTAAKKYADEWGLKRPKKVRAIAPNGTTGIVAETTGGIEPIFCVAYKRRYLKGTSHFYQYVVDPVAKRLIEEGVDPSLIEDAYTLSQDVERRVSFQAWVQQVVDQAISSTINLPKWGTEFNNSNLVRPFGNMLMKYLPKLRGITCYPDGGRGGQPLNPVSYAEAVGQEGIELVEEQQDICSLRGGNCGD